MREVLDFEYKSTSEFSQPVYNHSFLLRCTPQNVVNQKIVIVGAKNFSPPHSDKSWCGGS